METLVDIPYTAPDLPGPLPTQGQIYNAPLLSQRADTKIVQIDDKHAVKYGLAVQSPFPGGQNTIFLRAVTNIQVPKLCSVHHA